MPTELLEPVVNDGVRLTHFFNGRVLVAEDLQREQTAAQDRHRGLAGAVGEGVVRGLEVSVLKRELPAPTVRVTAGLAFNRDGDPVQLPRDVELRLIPASADVSPEAGVFSLCAETSSTSVITNPGFYLLAARPASSLSREQVPLVDVSSDGIGSRCGSRYTELGASFSLVSLPLPPLGTAPPLARKLVEISTQLEPLVELVRGGATGNTLLEMNRRLSLLRNGMAYWIAGRDSSGGRVAALAASFTPPPSVPTPLEALRASGALASCDVPLALIFVTKRRMEWVDLWSVRRAPVPRVGPDPLPLVSGGLPGAEAAASFLQFRDHAASFLAGDTPLAAAQVKASEWFLFLPPAGVLPVTAGTGFNATKFFEGKLANGPAPLDSARIPPLLRASLDHAPIDLSSTDRAWTYSVSGLAAPGAAPSLLFSAYPVEQELTILPVRITQVDLPTPPAGYPPGTVHEGDPVRMRGENFEGSSNGQQVLVDGAAVTSFTVRTDTELQFSVPSVAGLPPFGKQALVVVSNRSTSAIRAVTLLPRPGVPGAGSVVDVEFVTMTSSLLPGDPALFRFTIRNRTDRAGLVGLTAVANPNTWPLQILPAAQATAPIASIGLAVGEERTVFLKIPAIPTATEGTDFSVQLNANFAGLGATSGAQTFKVGGTEAAQDPGVSTFALTGSNPAGALQGTLLSVSPYYGVQALVSLVVTRAGDYVVKANFVNASGGVVTPSGWGVGIQGAPSEAPKERTFTVTAAELSAGGGIKSLPLQIQVNTLFFGDVGAEVQVEVQRSGQAVKRQLRFSVQRTGWIWYYF
jgi:hypothetical protein